MIKSETKLVKLSPSEGMHIRNIESGDIFQGDVFLGIYDSQDNYDEVTEEEYQEWLASEEERHQKEMEQRK